MKRLRVTVEHIYPYDPITRVYGDLMSDVDMASYPPDDLESGIVDLIHEDISDFVDGAIWTVHLEDV